MNARAPLCPAHGRRMVRRSSNIGPIYVCPVPGCRRIITRRAADRSAPRTSLEDELMRQIILAGIEPPKREYPYRLMIGGSRRWRADMAWPDMRLVVEVEGGTWAQGRHNRATGYAADCEKYNAAQIGGVIVLRFTGEHVASGYAVTEIARAVEMIRARRIERDGDKGS